VRAHLERRTLPPMHAERVEGPHFIWWKEMKIDKYFHELRFDDRHHLGLGDIRITMGQQEEIAAEHNRVLADNVRLRDTLLAVGRCPDEQECYLNASCIYGCVDDEGKNGE